MKKVIFCLISFQLSFTAFSQIIADHTVVDRYKDIPAWYINEVKKMFVTVPGESHTEAYRTGLTILNSLNPAYVVNVTESGIPEGYTDQHLRMSRATWGDVNNESGWIYYYGEEDWFTSPEAISRTIAGIEYCNTNGFNISAMGFGWCWDPAETDMTGYLAATQKYIDFCIAGRFSTKVFFTTGPVDNECAWGETGYNKSLAYNAIRSYALADSDRILFDYADILCYDDDGSGPNTNTWNGHTYPIITSTNLGDGGIGHIGTAGTLRLGKAMWWMLARIAGWDGYPVVTWAGGADGSETDWNTAGNWSGGEVPTKDVNVIIPAGSYLPVISSSTQADCHNLDIQPGTTLTIESDGSATGSLIVTGSSTGNVTCKRQLRTETNNGDYHYFSSPVASNSETNNLKVNLTWQWNEVTGDWSTLSITDLQSGRGYNLDQTAESDGLITFTGPLVTYGISIEATSPYSDITDGSEADYLAGRDFADGNGHSGTARSEDYPGYGGGGWNMLGNPYSSAINAMSFINYKRNLDNLEPSYQAVFLYDGDSPGHARYYYIGNPTGWEDDIPLGETHIQVGQGFFVLAMNDTSTFTFTTAMQEHNTRAAYLKSAVTEARWPGLQLKVSGGSYENNTTIVFNDGMTAGLDPGYDVGMMGFGPGPGIYTALVEDNGIIFTRQALPLTGISRLVVPVGIDFKKGGEVTFSAVIEPLRGYRFILEDHANGVYTDLGTGIYTVTLPENTLGQGRFFVHIETDRGHRQYADSINQPGLQIWAGTDNRVNIQGAVSDGAACRVYDLQGHIVSETRLSGAGFNTFSVLSEVRGVYIIKVTDGEKTMTQKVIFQ